MREADKAFQTVGGGTRHYLRECFLPILSEHGLAVVQLNGGEWRAIESAPKDGTAMLLIDEDTDCPVVARWHNSAWRVAWDDSEYTTIGSLKWRPLP